MYIIIFVLLKELANVLLQNGALTESVNNNRETLLHASVLGHQLVLTEKFLRSGKQFIYIAT